MTAFLPPLDTAGTAAAPGHRRLHRTVFGSVAVAMAMLTVLFLMPLTPASAAVVPGSQADLQITVSGPSSATSGDTFTYQVVMNNNSLPDADGATFNDSFSGGATNVAATCQASNGATCPASLTVSNTAISGTVGAFPHLGRVTITVTGKYTGSTSVTNTATITPPSGVTDPDTSSNTSFVNTSLSTNTDLEVTKTADHATITPGDAVKYTVVYTNNGPASADGAKINDYVSVDATGDTFSTYDLSDVTCTTTGDATCPTISDATGLTTQYGTSFNTTIPTFPSGSTVTLTYTDTFAAGTATCTTGTSPRVSNITQITAPDGATDPDTSNNYVQLAVPANVPACPEANLTVTKTADHATIAPGDAVKYTLTLTNNGPSPADGAALTDFITTYNTGNSFSTYDLADATCATTGGATCPTIPDATGVSTGYGTSFNATIPSFPSGSTVTITYTDTFAKGSSACTTAANPTVSNIAQITPKGATDPDTGDNYIQLTTPATVPACPEADLSVTKTADKTVVAPGSSVKYTVTYTNNGPSDADGASINDSVGALNTGSQFSTYDLSDVTCTTTGGATCPTIPDVTGQTVYYGTAYNTTIPTFPSGSSVTITYTDTFAKTSNVCSSNNSNPNVSNFSTINQSGVTDPDSSNNYIQQATAAGCAEISVNNTVSPSSIQSGAPFTYTVVVSNGGSSTGNHIAFSDPLVGNLNYVSADCAASTGTPTCGTISYDPATKTVSSTIPALAPGDAVTFTIHATGGVTSGTFTNIAKIATTAASTYYDPNPSSDSSRVNLQIFNTVSPVTIVKHIDGLTAAGLPEAETFTGTITCATQAARTWSVTVPKGADTASSTPVDLYDGESCTVTEDTPTTAPTGYTWSPTPVINPGTITPTSSTPITVDVTNTLIADPITAAQVIVTKQINGLPGGLPEAETFTGTLSCTTGTGDPTTGTWSVTVAKGQVTADSDPITEPVGSDCTVKENTPPAAPTGYTWTGVGVTPTSTGALTNGQVAAVTVTNTLTAAVTPTADPGSIRIGKTITGGPSAGVTGTFTFAAFCGTDVYRTSITVTKTDKGTGNLTGIPNGADCTIQETSKTAAPTGYTWKSAVVSAAMVHVTSDTVSDVTVTNPLTKTTTGTGGHTGTGGGTGTNHGTGTSTEHTATGRGAHTSLAFTGSNPKIPLLLGALLLGLGIGTAALGSRRRRHNN